MGNLLHRPHLVPKPDDIAREDFGRYLDLERNLHSYSNSLSMLDEKIANQETKVDRSEAAHSDNAVSEKRELNSMRMESLLLELNVRLIIGQQDEMRRR